MDFKSENIIDHRVLRAEVHTGASASKRKKPLTGKRWGLTSCTSGNIAGRVLWRVAARTPSGGAPRLPIHKGEHPTNTHRCTAKAHLRSEVYNNKTQHLQITPRHTQNEAHEREMIKRVQRLRGEPLSLGGIPPSCITRRRKTQDEQPKEKKSNTMNSQTICQSESAEEAKHGEENLATPSCGYNST